MTRQHDQVSTRSHADRDAHGDQGRADQPAVMMVRERLARGHVDPAEIAAIIDMHPAAAPEILGLLHRTVGNQVAMAVSGLIGKTAPQSDVDFIQEQIGELEAKEGHGKDASPQSDFDFIQEQIGELEAKEGHGKDAAPTKQPGSWVTRAQRYNRAHADDAAAFLAITGSACVDETTGEADPRKVARWQADHGLPPDGRIGSQTLMAATIDAS